MWQLQEHTGAIQGRISIEDRPDVVDSRERLGVVEVYLMRKRPRVRPIGYDRENHTDYILDLLEGTDSKVVQEK